MVVDRPRDKLLAGTRLAADEHSDRGGGRHLDEAEDLLHLVALADDLVELVPVLDLAPQAVDFTLEHLDGRHVA